MCKRMEGKSHLPSFARAASHLSPIVIVNSGAKVDWSPKGLSPTVSEGSRKVPLKGPP
jgi:hypothetical protein